MRNRRRIEIKRRENIEEIEIETEGKIEKDLLLKKKKLITFTCTTVPRKYAVSRPSRPAPDTALTIEI